MKFSNKIRSFMKGRYGPDNLYNFLFFIYILLIVINTFFKSNILRIFELIIIIIIFYRLLSKNVYARSRENQKYLKIKSALIKPFVNMKRNILDKEHVYKRCKKCKTVLKLPLPSKRGFNKAKCPHCKSTVRLFTLKKEKIEIIVKNKK